MVPSWHVSSHLQWQSTLFAMAIAQMLVPVIALVIAKSQVTMELRGVVGVFGLNAFFAMLFIGSALLFRSATNTGSK